MDTFFFAEHHLWPSLWFTEHFPIDWIQELKKSRTHNYSIVLKNYALWKKKWKKSVNFRKKVNALCKKLTHFISFSKSGTTMVSTGTLEAGIMKSKRKLSFTYICYIYVISEIGWNWFFDFTEEAEMFKSYRRSMDDNGVPGMTKSGLER